MNVQHLRCLVETIKAGSISAAARKLGKSHSTISTAIASLEDDLGLTLLDRSGHKPKMTQDGKRLLPDIIRALEGCDYLRTVADSLVAGAERSVRVVCDSTAPMQPMLNIADSLALENVSTKFRLDVTFGNAETEVMEQRADLGMVTRTRSLKADIGNLTIAHYRWAYFCHVEHPLMQHAPEITSLHLDQHVNVVLDEVHQAAASLRHIGRNTVHVNSPLSLYFMLLNQHGFAMMPEFLGDFMPGSQLAKFTPKDLPTEIKLPCCLVWNPQVSHGPIVQRMIARAHELYG